MWQFINGQLVWVKDAASFRGGRFNHLKIHGEGEGGSGNGGNGNKEPTVAELQAQMKTLNDSLAKMENKNKELLTENKTMRESTKAWEGLDPSHVRNLLQKIEGDEELKLITEGKHDEVIKKRTEKVEATYKAQLKTLQDENENYKKQLGDSESRIKKLMIDNTIASKFISAKGLETAVDDIVARAHSVFKIENGEAIPRDSKGEIMQGKNGIMTQEEWIESLRTTAPHLFPAGESGAPKGNTSKQNTSDIDLKIEAARKAGDTNEMRRLKNEKAAAGRKR